MPKGAGWEAMMRGRGWPLPLTPVATGNNSSSSIAGQLECVPLRTASSYFALQSRNMIRNAHGTGRCCEGFGRNVCPSQGQQGL